MHRVAVAFASLLALGCAQKPERTAREAPPIRGDTAAWTVSFTSYGSLRTGRARVEMLKALGVPPQEGRAKRAEAAAECEFVGIPDSPLSRAVHVMVVHDTLVRVDIDSLPVATAWGDRIGDSEAAVLGRHLGQVRVEPHPYTGPQGHYVIVTSPSDTMYRLIFETDGEHVVSYRAGLRPAVDWIEGCA